MALGPALTLSQCSHSGSVPKAFWVPIPMAAGGHDVSSVLNDWGNRLNPSQADGWTFFDAMSVDLWVGKTQKFDGADRWGCQLQPDLVCLSDRDIYRQLFYPLPSALEMSWILRGITGQAD